MRCLFAECPEPVNPAAISLAVISAIVAVGLALLLIWKLFTTIHDRREFAKFEKERQNAKWDTVSQPLPTISHSSEIVDALRDII